MSFSSCTVRRCLLVGLLGLVAAPTGVAQGSDGSLRKAVSQQERKLKPLRVEFAKADDDPYSAVGTERFELAEIALRKATISYRKAVVGQKATKLAASRSRLIVGLDGVLAALRVYRQGQKLVGDERPSQARTTFATAASRLKAADRRVAAAVKQIR